MIYRPALASRTIELSIFENEKHSVAFESLFFYIFYAIDGNDFV